MAAKKKAVKKSPTKKPAAKKQAASDRCPTCGMAPCNVPSDMRKTGKPKARKAKPVVPPESAPMVDAETPPFPELTDQEADEAIDAGYCPLCDEPDDSCTCGLDDDEEDSE